MSRWDAIKHAFAIEAKGPYEPTAEQQPSVDWVCRQVVKRGLATPALMGLELFRPLNYVSAQAMHFFRPMISTVSGDLTIEQYRHFAAVPRGPVVHRSNTSTQERGRGRSPPGAVRSER